MYDKLTEWVCVSLTFIRQKTKTMKNKAEKEIISRIIGTNLNPMMRSLIVSCMKENENRIIKECAGEVPDSWLDPLLSGDKKVIKGELITLSDVQEILIRVRLRIEAKKW